MNVNGIIFVIRANPSAAELKKRSKAHSPQFGDRLICSGINLNLNLEL